MSDSKENNMIAEHNHDYAQQKEQDKPEAVPEQILADFQKLDSEIKFGVKELQNQLNCLKGNLTEWSGLQKSLNRTLEQNLSSLARETTILTALPDKLGKHLDQLVPNIATELSGNVFQEFNAALKTCNEAMSQLDHKIQIAAKTTGEINSKGLKKTLKSMALTLSITIISSTILTYFLMQRFPTRFTINTNGNITVDGGDVSIWGTGKNTVQTKKK